MLDAQFPRIPGDMGNATSWPFPVHYKIVKGASPEKVVLKGAEGLLQPFIDAARELIDDGVDGITTNCGFLARFQSELTRQLPVPVISSSLMQVSMVDRILPAGNRTGILTISAATLTPELLELSGCKTDTPVWGTPADGEFSGAILGNRIKFNIDKARAENITAAKAFHSAHPELGAIVLECTNMAPYAADIRQATGLPTFSILNFISWFQAGLVPKSW